MFAHVEVAAQLILTAPLLSNPIEPDRLSLEGACESQWKIENLTFDREFSRNLTKLQAPSRPKTVPNMGFIMGTESLSHENEFPREKTGGNLGWFLRRVNP